MNVILFILSLAVVFCIGYYIFAASYAGIASSFLGFWLLAAFGFAFIIFLIFANRKYNFYAKIPRGIRMTGMVLIICLISIFLLMEALILSKMNSRAKKGADYVIVLGAQVRGTRVTKSLAKRLDAACEYLRDNPETKVVCTGGQGRGEDISEAMAEKGYLIEKGISEDRIIVEDKSTSTYQNLEYAESIINDRDASVAIVTNNFHVYRAVHLGKYVGFEDVDGIAAKSDNRLLLNYMVREGLALAKELVLHRIGN